MYQPSVFCLKLQLHFGGDIHEISVPTYNGAEPTVTDLMNVIERDFRVPRALQNLIFHGQDLHPYTNEPLSRFGIKNGVPIRLVGRMTPPDMIQQVNNQYNVNSYQQSCYDQQSCCIHQPNAIATFHTCEQSLPYYPQEYQRTPDVSVGTQYDPPSSTVSPNQNQPPATPNQGH
ncbi:unnamed protein product [Adineta steineri]|uniref:Ubiquitin-like domain-containing protein n=1 Tax=Adineta steineri TaxID=433720 RepID=A0A813UC62_9BILA|nr:unnamed protein product [Adineta steineri]CAF0821703.1 unnamed protein product [Adineta steineri]CAF0862204.1 unnamed protein product [Adineta steineri]